MTENTTVTETDVIAELQPPIGGRHHLEAHRHDRRQGDEAVRRDRASAAEARQVGLTLRETVLVIFGSPAAGTPVMAASPLSALDLPLKVLIWSDGGQTKVSSDSPAALAARHRLAQELA